MKDEGTQLVQSARQLEVYKRAKALALAIHHASLNFPKIEQYALADQLRRASKSVTANLAEGFAKQQFSKAEFARFIAMAEGSAQESITWLDYAQALEYITQKQWLEWEKEYIRITGMLYRLRIHQKR